LAPIPRISSNSRFLALGMIAGPDSRIGSDRYAETSRNVTRRPHATLTRKARGTLRGKLAVRYADTSRYVTQKLALRYAERSRYVTRTHRIALHGHLALRYAEARATLRGELALRYTDALTYIRCVNIICPLEFEHGGLAPTPEIGSGSWNWLRLRPRIGSGTWVWHRLRHRLLIQLAPAPELAPALKSAPAP
jgi:hypothetical protein